MKTLLVLLALFSVSLLVLFFVSRRTTGAKKAEGFANLRYVIEVLPPPLYPQNPGWGEGTSAGTPVKPTALKLPK